MSIARKRGVCLHCGHDHDADDALFQSALRTPSQLRESGERQCLRAFTDGRCSAPHCQCPYYKVPAPQEGTVPPLNGEPAAAGTPRVDACPADAIWPLARQLERELNTRSSTGALWNAKKIASVSMLVSYCQNKAAWPKTDWGVAFDLLEEAFALSAIAPMNDTARLDWLQSQLSKGWGDGFAIQSLDSKAYYVRPWKKSLESMQGCEPDMATGVNLWQPDIRTAIDECIRRTDSAKGKNDGTADSHR